MVKNLLLWRSKNFNLRAKVSIFLVALLLLVAGVSFKSMADSIATGGTLFTLYRDTRVMQAPSALSDVITTLSDPGTKVIWLQADPNSKRWQKIQVSFDQKQIEGYVTESNLSLKDPSQSTPVWVQTAGGGKSAAGLVIATAATRAFMDFSPTVHQYAKTNNNLESVSFLAKLTNLQQPIDSLDINRHNREVGIFSLPESFRTFFSDSNKNQTAAIPSVFNGSFSERPMNPETELQKCMDFADYPVEENEARQISDLAALAIIERFGGLLIDKPTGINDLLTYVYIVAQNLAARSYRPSPYRVLILNSPQINAFSTPGGDIFLTRGLLDLLKTQGNESQLAFILGHEIKHIASRDGLSRWRETKAQLCTQILQSEESDLKQLKPAMQAALSGSCQGSLNLSNAAPLLTKTFTNQFVRQLSCKSYQKDEELAADEEALRLSVLSGYRPDYQTLFALFEERKGFGNHPKNEVRRVHLDSFLQSLKPRPGFFGYQDWPFSSYPFVPFAQNQFQSLDAYEKDPQHASLSDKNQTYFACGDENGLPTMAPISLH